MPLQVVGNFELSWPEHRVGIWNEHGKASPIPPTLAGWHLYHLEEVRQAPYLLSHQLVQQATA